MAAVGLLGVLLSSMLMRCAASGGVMVMMLERAFPPPRGALSSDAVARDRARDVRLFDGTANFTLAGDAAHIGVYYTQVQLGTPPRKFHVQFDTGSDVLWVTCSSCTVCPRSTTLNIQLNLFNTSASLTARLLPCFGMTCSSSTVLCHPSGKQCDYNIKYEDGSGTSGFYVSDVFHFDARILQSVAPNSAHIAFGCSTLESGRLTTTAMALDGIFGFGQGHLSVISQLSSRQITPMIFSHCLRGDGNGGGILVLGEVFEPGIVYSPILPSQPHYSLNLRSISVSGQILDINPAVFTTGTNPGAIIDSGTTFAYLVEEAFDAFVNAITATVSHSAPPLMSGGNQCYLVPISVSEIFPLVSFNFADGASMLLKPQEYLLSYGYHNGEPKWCIGFLRGLDGLTILGDLALKEKILVYDLARQRIGWKDFNCSSLYNVSFSGDSTNERQRIHIQTLKLFLFMFLIFGHLSDCV